MSDSIVVRLRDEDGAEWNREVSWQFSVEDVLSLSNDDWDKLFEQMKVEIKAGWNFDA